MDRKVKLRVQSVCCRLQLPVYVLALLLSRAPALKFLIEKNFNLIPRASHLLKWMSGTTAMVGAVNTVTGATASVQLLEGYDNTTGYLGEYFRLSFASTDYVVGSYRLGGAAPEGLSLSPTVTEFGVGTIDGIPTRAGVYNVDIWAYEEKNQTGDSTLLALTVYIREKGAHITSQPSSVNTAWSSAFELEVELQDDNGALFQWRKNGVDIPGATSETYAVTQATSSDEGSYDVVISKDGTQVTSESATVSVLASDLERWKESAFDNPFSSETDPQQDPDLDGLINLVEYAIGTDPMKASAVQLPQVGFERVLTDSYVVYTYAKNPLAGGVSISAEYTDDLANPNWIPIIDFLNGIRVVDTSDNFVVKVPQETACFVSLCICRVLGAPAVGRAIPTDPV